MKRLNTKVALGDRAKDRITGFQGIIVIKADFLTGCTRWGIQPETLGEHGVLGEVQHFDDGQLILVRAGVIPCRLPGTVEHEPGGPRPSVAQSDLRKFQRRAPTR